jgi:N-methylhydantoinase B
MDHGRVGPPGLFGGHDGAPNEVIVEQGGRTYTSPHWWKGEDIRVTSGDLVIVRTPGGGGYGDPLERDPARVRRDVARGYFTAEDAERDYGVVLHGAPLAVDATATARARAARRARR